MSDDFSPYALVVDDEPIIRMDAADILEDAGFRTYQARNGDEALAALASFGRNIQLLFTDVQMPGDTNGFALARECSKRWPHISILVASGAQHPDPDDMPEGAVFMGKPFSANVIYDRLQELLPDGQKPAPLKERAD
jgi:CheY-like chemotaxis protein